VIIDHSRLLTGYRQKFAEINSLLAVSQIINSSLELEAVLGTVLENMIRLIEAEGGSLLLVDQKRQVLEFKIVQGAKADELKRLTLRLGEGIAGWVAAHGRPLLVDDTHRDARFTAKVDQVTRFETKSILCVPLKVKDRVIGVVEVVNKKNRANFTDADVKLLSALASPAAIAIDNAKLYADLEQLFFAVVRSLAATIELRDPYTRGHSGNVARVARLIAAQAGRPATELERLELAGLLHDIGKIGIPEQVLNKPGKLTDEEFRVIQQHPMMGVKVVENVEQLADLVPVMRHHHERFDGKGYPDRLQGTAIPLWARITAIADTYDAMTSDRVYRKGMEPAAALAEINRCSGTQFDPALVKVFNAVFKKGALNRKDQAF
jgi:putative nucleotidyltransferase with HDIG domain